MLKNYVSRVFKVSQRGDAREESYYSALESLLRDYAESVGKRGTDVTTLPKKTEGGNPDFRVWDGKEKIVGYIEAKDPSVAHLDQIETSEQLKRYLGIFPNLILTNFHEFRLYRNGDLIDQVLIARPVIGRKLKVVPPVEREEKFLQLLEKFFSFSLPAITDAKTLAEELAKRTRFLRDEIISEELKAGKGRVAGFYEAFKKYLIGGLTKEDFADLYSQTITYGLFASRTRSENGFNRRLAYYNIPATIGILRDVFKYISLEDPPQQMEWIIDDISQILANTKVNDILHRYFHEGKGKDPIIHFYETFLTEYDPDTRERRGVYYTPEPVVSYIVRSLHKILKEEFNRPDGFASTSVTVLDPAAGTLTFLAEAAKVAVDEFVEKYGEGGKQNLIKEHILKNFYAFELMMAPYAVGHLKMGFLLEELGYKLKKDDRFKLYLTNTLEMEELTQTDLPGMASLSEESHLAGKVKKETPILVILGNPPYSAVSANMGEWIMGLIEDYKYVDGKHFGERKHWLQDDYVKFIRFAQWKINQAGEGVLGFITNHSYLDNPTFRGMRQSLMKSFDEIYVLDLHGNSLKKEKCPDGAKDENVFDIQQGVAISLFVKRRSKVKNVRIYHSEFWGLRENKYDSLKRVDIKSISWQELAPLTPFYFFVPRKEKGIEIYQHYCNIMDIFLSSGTGIFTGKDHFVVDFAKEPLKARVLMFMNKNLSNEMVKQGLNLKENYMWRVAKARKDLYKDENWQEYFKEILYRPFDIRDIYYHDSVVWRPRKEIMRHLLRENLALCVGRAGQVVGLEKPWNIVFISKNIVDLNLFYRGGEQVFPLYVYFDQDKKDLFSYTKKSEKRKPNVKPEIFKNLASAFKKEPTPEEIFYYIYAVLYSNTYRTKYAEFLKIDFPRIPFTNDYKLFSKMGEYGKQLVDLHLLRFNFQLIAKFPVKGDAVVEKLRYDEKQKCVYINKEQYFEGIPKDVWEYQIGGYQVCEKWLKDRKGRRLSLEEIKHYCNIVTALQKTIEVQKEIDAIYPQVEQDVIQFGK